MYGKQPSRNGCWPDRCRAPAQHEEQQDSIRSMQQQVGQMVSTRLQPVEFPIYLERYPGEWVPIKRIETCQCPPDAPTRQSSLNSGILSNILVVVEVNKSIVANKQGAIREQSQP